MLVTIINYFLVLLLLFNGIFIIQVLSKKLHDMQQEQVGLQSKIDQYKRKLLEISHRVLQVFGTRFIYSNSTVNHLCIQLNRHFLF